MDENSIEMLTPSINENSAINLDNPYPTHYRPRTLSMHRNKTPRMSRVSTDWVHISTTEMPQENHVNQIVDKIEDEVQCSLNEGIVLGVQFRQDTLKHMPENLTIKKLVKEKLNLRLQTSGKKISLWRQFNFNLRIYARKCKSRFEDFLYEFELWYSTMKRIEGEFGSATATYFRFFRFLFLLNCFTFSICFSFIALPQILETVLRGKSATSSFQASDFFTGEGYYTNTLLYYGFYSNDSISIINNVHYSMPRGYFYTMIVVYLGVLMILAFSMAKSYRRNFIETKGGLKNVFAHKVFCTWDFGIATQRAARLKSSSIFYELKELLNDERKPRPKTNFATFMLRFIANLMIMAILPTIGYSIWLLLESHRNDETEEYNGVITALAITAVIYIVPIFMALLCRHEDYKSPRTTFYITLIRTFLLYAVIIGVLAGFWLFQVHTIAYCWETKLGQEVYRLLIFDFLIALIFFILEKCMLVLYALIKRTEIERAEFKIVDHTLQLIYNQALFWLGLLFAPALSALIVLKYIIMWYFLAGIEIKMSKPSKTFWRATHMQTWFLVMSFLTLLIMMAVLGSIIALVKASECGPFGGTTGIVYIYDFLKNEILTMEQGFLVWQVLAYMLKPGAVALILLSMTGFIYHLRSKAIVQDKMIHVLKDMIVVESRDKDYLLKRIHMMAKDITNEVQADNCSPQGESEFEHVETNEDINH